MWESLPSFLAMLVPRLLDFLKRRNLTITMFVVGQDAQHAITMMKFAGHEIGNHSLHHDPWLHVYSAGHIERELDRAEECIEVATRQRPTGFRGPGFSLCIETTNTRQTGYLYDTTRL